MGAEFRIKCPPKYTHLPNVMPHVLTQPKLPKFNITKMFSWSLEG